MNSKMADQDYCVIVGMGATGYSCAKFLAKKGIPFVLVDTRKRPPMAEEFKKAFPATPVQMGVIDPDCLSDAKKIIMSPGLSPHEAFLDKARQKGVPIIGDIELFYRHAKAPIVAITGSNAKSTVTTLVGEMAKAAGTRVAVGGNLGTPALDLLQKDIELYVLELSSFQLELLDQFKAKVAAFLNLSEDHLDRYGSLNAYQLVKQRVYTGSEVMVFNADDSATVPVNMNLAKVVSFTLKIPKDDQFGLCQRAEGAQLARGNECLLSIKQMGQVGLHNAANALAALAIGESLGISMPVMLNVLKSFQGLPHRCQLIKEINGVRYINDSKGTNVGATLAAIAGLAQQKNIVLIAGGEGKGADFFPLRRVCEKAVKACVLIGRDAPLIAEAIGAAADILYMMDMDSAVKTASQVARSGDVVLLSPACASFDMFKNYEHRGACFIKAVEGLAA